MNQPHAPLLEARRLIDSGKIRLLSLDIFDTTVWRVPSRLPPICSSHWERG
jgi:hypothetical protein